MYKLILKLPFDVTVVLKEDFNTKVDAHMRLLNLPAGFEVVEKSKEDLSKAIEVPFKERVEK